VSAEAYQLWTLPDGTEIAYRPFAPEGNDPQGTPVIMLHGGPGVPILPALGPPGPAPWTSWRSRAFPSSNIDQRGAGFSERLDLARERPYTMASHVADLEGIREALGAEELILVGHGWGSTLASQYLLAHPGRVSRMVALSPAPLWYPAHPELVEPSARARLSDVQASALAVLEKPSLRLVLGRLTSVTSRRAAHTLIRDWEADEWWTRITRESIRLRQPHMTCGEQAQARIPPPTGLGYFAYSYTLDDALRIPDPRPALAEPETPTLIVRGFCDYIRWQVAYDYLQVLRDARQVSTSASGHLLWMEQPEILETVMIPFLAGEPVPLSYYHPERRP